MEKGYGYNARHNLVFIVAEKIERPQYGTFYHVHQPLSDRARSLTEYVKESDRFELINEAKFLSLGGKHYVHEQLSLDQIIADLLDVFYKHEPRLQGGTMVGTSLKGIENDPNEHTGIYHLNNGKTYHMTKYYDKLKLYEVPADFNGVYNHITPFFVHTVDFEKLKLTMEWKEMNRKFIFFPARSLEEGLPFFERYYELQKIINDMVIEP
jgi:hypothetical protein